MKIIMVLLVWIALLPSMAQAETAYVTDRLFVSLRDAQGKEASAIKSIAAGTELDVLQRLDGFVQVREPGGIEGWIAERYLINAPPGNALLQATKNKLRSASSSVAKLTQQLANSSKEASALKNKLESLGISQQDGTESANVPSRADATTQSKFYFNWVWLLISFAMLVTGFIAGVVWLRELNRKKMGGMYLRV